MSQETAFRSDPPKIEDSRTFQSRRVGRFGGVSVGRKPGTWALALAVVLTLALPRLAGADPDQQDQSETSRFSPASRGPRAAVLARSEVEEIAAEVFGPELAGYVANIAYCESRHNRFARSAGWDRFYGWYEYLGLMQVSTMWRGLAVEVAGSDDLTDAYVNLMTARAIQRAQGWRAWPVCSR